MSAAVGNIGAMTNLWDSVIYPVLNNHLSIFDHMNILLST